MFFRRARAADKSSTIIVNRIPAPKDGQTNAYDASLKICLSQEGRVITNLARAKTPDETEKYRNQDRNLARELNGRTEKHHSRIMAQWLAIAQRNASTHCDKTPYSYIEMFTIDRRVQALLSLFLFLHLSLYKEVPLGGV